MPYAALSDHQAVDTALPVSEAVFARLCRLTPIESKAFSMTLTDMERARLALFCNSRAHLRESGREIASICSRESLALEGGQAGLVLFQQARSGPGDTWGMPGRPTARRISLAG